MVDVGGNGAGALVSKEVTTEEFGTSSIAVTNLYGNIMGTLDVLVLGVCYSVFDC